MGDDDLKFQMKINEREISNSTSQVLCNFNMLHFHSTRMHYDVGWSTGSVMMMMMMIKGSEISYRAI